MLPIGFEKIKPVIPPCKLREGMTGFALPNRF
jgi:hypothetical protein